MRVLFPASPCPKNAFWTSKQISRARPCIQAAYSNKYTARSIRNACNNQSDGPLNEAWRWHIVPSSLPRREAILKALPRTWSAACWFWKPGQNDGIHGMEKDPYSLRTEAHVSVLGRVGHGALVWRIADLWCRHKKCWHAFPHTSKERHFKGVIGKMCKHSGNLTLGAQD
jgi:hypothetical protein